MGGPPGRRGGGPGQLRTRQGHALRAPPRQPGLALPRDAKGAAAPGRGAALLLVGAGGALGTLLRFTLGTAMPPSPGAWPWTTVGINVSGALLLGILLESLSGPGEHRGWHRVIRLGVGTGMLGGYTTYSTFMLDSLALGSGGDPLPVLAHVAATSGLGIVAAWLGIAGTAAVRRRGLTR